ncbi:MAG: DUF4167 domain-containing protein [Rhodobacteraceae bacterium]|jgi:hypothetical protein|nr:DUF4167 domain-containing protein [Paracoccaceae bacterium]
MRSSKSRSRSKANRPRTLGNIINRVFDSSGPEGKVRGTPAQIIEKYQFLARDAQLSNDRVAAENFNQHAEHYTRMLAEAQREMAAEQEARQGQYGNGGQPSQGQNGNGHAPQGGNAGQPRDNRPARDDRDYRENREFRNDRGDRPDRGNDRNTDRSDRDFRHEDRQPHAIDVVEPDDDLGLVETPEMDVQPQPRPERPQAERQHTERPQQDRGNSERPARREAAISPMMPDLGLVQVADPAPSEAKADRGPRRPRAPRKPKTEGTPDAAE